MSCPTERVKGAVMPGYSPPPDLREPPPSTRRVLITGLVGVALAAIALVIGLVSGAPTASIDRHGADGPRAVLTIVGLIVAGSAVSLRPSWFGGWLCYAAVGLLGYGFGSAPKEGTEWFLIPERTWIAALPNSWDSIQTFFGIAGASFGAVAAVATLLPLRIVGLGVLTWVAFHFAGIISAITSPPPTPWITDQYWKRVSRPYLQFTYMNNAYQFYSPDPGPATEIWACIEYVTPESTDSETTPEKDTAWVLLPRRPQDVMDPLGLTYYRRLSITENVAQYQPPEYSVLPAELDRVMRRREVVKDFVPKSPNPDAVQYRVPTDIVTRQLLPSYARHICSTYGDPNKKVKTVKIYRTTHSLLSLQQYRGQLDANTGQLLRVNPYYPHLYMAYFQGEFTPDGKVLSTTDPLLYWHIPIMQVGSVLPPTYEEYLKKGGFDAFYQDYVAKHAGSKRPRGGPGGR